MYSLREFNRLPVDMAHLSSPGDDSSDQEALFVPNLRPCIKGHIPETEADRESRIPRSEFTSLIKSFLSSGPPSSFP
ncbi:hypothetical protein CYMTET_40648 [Cymbomonas tetramitiformis]|uniref:Uncharacterized protein n=1 Tax=Cymbomonas tetramitiformis TaxID=36881 RepID=A0AAE0C8Q7_9CHLO|nr:hypothetical protein CYMTET_40648 [Cymbomonas tetramitiformis]